MTWAIIAWTVLMGVWIVGGVASQPGLTPEDRASCAETTAIMSEAECLETMQAAGEIGTGIGVVLLGLLWFVGFIVLTLIWFMTRPKEKVVVVREVVDAA
jgi:hypothetical protein